METKPSTQIENAEALAFTFQHELLTRCVNKLTFPDNANFWIFLHLRSIAIRATGRKTIYEQTKPTDADSKIVDLSLKLQHSLEKDFRTYNELLISRPNAEPNLKNVLFCFNDSPVSFERPFPKIVFSETVIREVTEGKRFQDLLAEQPVVISSQVRKKLADLRLSIGLGEEIRQFFELDGSNENVLRVFPEEVRYALQILMIWSNTFSWRYIYTFHSRTRFEALSGLVLTVASSEGTLPETSILDLQSLITESEHKVEEIARKKQKAINNHYKRIFGMNLQNSVREFSNEYDLRFDEKLAIKTSREEDESLSGEFVMLTLRILFSVFASTFEGRAETYSFVLGHPGFVGRPSEVELENKILFSDLPKYRELCEGGLDRLNIVDVLDEPSDDKGNCLITPVAFPNWAKYGRDNEQEFGFSLSNLSSVYREMLVVGIVCRNTAMIFKSGELIADFNGAWREIRSWNEVADYLELPDFLMNDSWLKSIYKILVGIAYGPSPRSVILGYFIPSSSSADFLENHCKPMSGEHSSQIIGHFEGLRDVLFIATKTDGAIFVSRTNDDKVELIYKRRVTLSSDSSAEATGTGDATAQALAEKVDNMLSFKISQDGGLKVRWQNRPKCEAHERR